MLFSVQNWQFFFTPKCIIILGLTFGGSWGLYEGLRNPDGKTMKLRLNSVLNGMTRRGPFMANSLGVVGKFMETLPKFSFMKDSLLMKSLSQPTLRKHSFEQEWYDYILD